MKYQPKTMLDSGAFSAWYHKESIDLDAYIEFVKGHQEHFYSIVALDVIPGAGAVMAKTTATIEAAAIQSHKNFLKMQKAGIDAIPVFHMGEDWSWLDRMIADRIPYIGISPYLQASTDNIVKWLDKVYTRIGDKDGAPVCKTHGFGVTGHQLVRRYPWFSLDSTSWALSAGYGNILMPSYGKPWDYTRPNQFSLSERDEAGNNSMLHHGPATRLLADRYFDALGLTFSEVRNFQEARLIVNASYYKGLEDQLSVTPFAFPVAGIKPRKASERIVPFNYSPTIVLATMIKIQQQGVVLTRVQAKLRLISYYDCRKFEKEYIDEYTTNGFCERGAYSYKRGSKSDDLRRRLLFLKRFAAAGADDE